MKRHATFGLPLLLWLATFGGELPAPALGDEEPPHPVVAGRGDGPFGAFPQRSVREAPADEPSPLDRGVGDALKWLAAHQSPNGSWEAAGFHRWCDGKPAAGGPDGLGKENYDVGVTGLAVSAFLAAGHPTGGRHPFSAVVAKALRYLRNVQDLEGCFGKRRSQHYIYNHGVATLAMVEAYGMTGKAAYRTPAQRGLDFLRLARNPGFAWRYGVRPGDNDTSVAAWMTHPLLAARVINRHATGRGKPAPFEVDEAAFDGVASWVESMTEARSGRVGYIRRGGAPARPQELIDRFPGEKSESMTAAGLWLRYVTGVEGDAGEELVTKATALILGRPPVWNPADGSIDMYYWYYGSLALYQVGSDVWTTWRKTFEETVLHQQRKDTTYCLYKGSWDPIGPWGMDGGRVYATALLALALLTDRRYARVR